MTDLYWVGGTANWDGTAGTKWATSSGGTGGHAVPTSTDNVFIDGNSGAVTITVATSTRSCLNLDFTGFTGTFAGSIQLNVSGSITLGASMTMSYTGPWNLIDTSSATITSNGIVFASNLFPAGIGGSWALQDNFSSTGIIGVTDGTFNANNKNVNISKMQQFGGAATAILMGSGTWTITGNGIGGNAPWNASGGVTSVTPATSTIKYTDNSSNNKVFFGGVQTYNNIWNATSGTGIFIIGDSNTFNNFRSDAGRTNEFIAGTTTTIASMSVDGTVGNLTIIESNAGTYNIVGTGSTINLHYVNISNCHFSGVTVNAYNSIDGGGNSGITFIGDNNFSNVNGISTISISTISGTAIANVQSFNGI